MTRGIYPALDHVSVRIMTKGLDLVLDLEQSPASPFSNLLAVDRKQRAS